MTFETVRTALAWLDRGVSVIPCKPRSKIAAIRWKRYQNKLPSSHRIRAWFENEHRYNLAVLCGGVNHLVVLDFDDLARYIAWKRKHRDLAQSYRVRTARGMHVYLFLDHTAQTQYLDGMELRAQGAYVLAVPSVHPSGAIYQAEDPHAAILHTTLERILPSGLTQYKTDSTETERATTAALSISTAECEWRHDLIGEIRRALPILDFVTRFTQPVSSDRGGGRWYKARCVFPQNHRHNDHHPSFWIDVRRGICGCHAPDCKRKQGGRAMDVINLYAALYGIDNRAAILQLANELQLVGLPAALIGA